MSFSSFSLPLPFELYCHTHIRSHTHSHSHTRSLAHTHTHAHTYTHNRSELTFSLSLPFIHSGSHTHSLSGAPLSLSLCLSHIYRHRQRKNTNRSHSLFGNEKSISFLSFSLSIIQFHNLDHNVGNLDNVQIADKGNFMVYSSFFNSSLVLNKFLFSIALILVLITPTFCRDYPIRFQYISDSIYFSQIFFSFYDF